MKGRRRLISYTIAPLRGFLIFCLIFLLISGETIGQPYRQQRCSNKLESALDNMRRRSLQVKSSRSMQSPYDIYYSLYGQQYEPEDEHSGQFYSGDDYYSSIAGAYGHRGYYAKNIQHKRRNAENNEFWENNARQPHKLTVTRVDVEDLKVRLPPKPAKRWVEVEKCKFSTENATLDTRLIFPDLTISGRVVLQPTGGKCNMILRLRRAGIEFHTTPIGFNLATNEESRRLGAATVRTDSHFAEPGFISVFAHGCQGPTGIRVRQNSKRRFGYVGAGEADKQPDIELSEPQIFMGTTNNGDNNRWGKLHDPFYPNYDIRKILKFAPSGVRDKNLDWHDYSADSRESPDDFRPEEDNFYRRQGRGRFKRNTRRSFPENDEVNFNDDILNFSDDRLDDLAQPDARTFADLFSGDEMVGDALTGELEKVFSMGVKGLLTTYMQRALQPAIKETLMENMGYRLSYG